MKAIKAITSIPGWLTAMSQSSTLVRDTASAYAYVPLIYRGVQIRADALSSVPVKLLRRNREIDWMLQTPPGALLWHIEASMLLTGAAYCEILTGPEVVDLRVINPYSMSVDYKNGVYVFAQNGVEKWSNTPAAGEYEILYIREYNPRDDIHPGVSALDVATMDAQLARNITRYAAKYFESGTMPVTLLGLEHPLSDSETQRVQGFFRRATEGISNAFRVLALRGDIKPQVLTPQVKDLMVPELYATVRDNIAQALGVPKSYFNESSNFATAEEDTNRFWTTTVRPRGRMIEAEINRQVFSRLRIPAQMVLEFEGLDVFQVDEAKRASSLLSLVNAGMPLRVALSVLGYDLPDDMLAEVEDRAESGYEADLKKWQKKAARRLKRDGRAQCRFDSPHIPEQVHDMVYNALANVRDAEALPLLYNAVRDWRGYP